jgi:hypothetical protein
MSSQPPINPVIGSWLKALKRGISRFATIAFLEDDSRRSRKRALLILTFSAERTSASRSLSLWGGVGLDVVIQNRPHLHDPRENRCEISESD